MLDNDLLLTPECEMWDVGLESVTNDGKSHIRIYRVALTFRR